MPLKVIALGTGVCANCISAPGPRRQPPGFLVDCDGNLLLLDASEGIRFRIEDAGYDYGALKHVAITHSHPDHAALPQIIQAKLCRVLWGRPVDGMNEFKIYMHEALVEKFSEVWAWHHPEGDVVYKDRLNWSCMPMRTGVETEPFAGLKLKPFGVYHGFGQHPSLGFRLETAQGTVVYTGDAGLTDSLFEAVANADLLISDASSRVGQDSTAGYGHMSPKQCGEIALRGNVKELWMTHYTGLDTPAAMEEAVRATGFAGVVKAATDGLVWNGASKRV